MCLLLLSIKSHPVYKLIVAFNREWESLLLPIFVSSPTFGTRSSTLLLIDQRDHVTFIERTFDAEGNNAGMRKYELRIED